MDHQHPRVTPADSLTPSTQLLARIKREATLVKKEAGFKHAEALDLVARNAGFSNFTDAQRRCNLAGTKPLAPQPISSGMVEHLVSPIGQRIDFQNRPMALAPEHVDIDSTTPANSSRPPRKVHACADTFVSNLVFLEAKLGLATFEISVERASQLSHLPTPKTTEGRFEYEMVMDAAIAILRRTSLPEGLRALSLERFRNPADNDAKPECVVYGRDLQEVVMEEGRTGSIQGMSRFLANELFNQPQTTYSDLSGTPNELAQRCYAALSTLSKVSGRTSITMTVDQLRVFMGLAPLDPLDAKGRGHFQAALKEIQGMFAERGMPDGLSKLNIEDWPDMLATAAFGELGIDR